MYEVDEAKRTTMIDKEGERISLANFSAKITKETRFTDGKNSNTVLTITGEGHKVKFGPTEIPADKFTSMAWVLPEWGTSAVIQPGQSSKEHLRTAIQLASKPIRETVYTHTGWTKIGGKWVYLHTNGAVTEKGDNPRLRVILPMELRRFNMKTTPVPKGTIGKTFELLNLGARSITWPLVAAIIAPLHGKVDFAVHYAGRTGTFKSEVASLAQSHYGEEMDARGLPGSWSSTANALEAQAFRAKNAVFCVDDYIPSGTSWQVKSYEKTADQLIRGQGNQAGRARLTDVSSLQTTMFPRGLVLSTGEDTPAGHSVRARMLIIELSPDDIDVEQLTKSQANRPFFNGNLANYIQYMAPNYDAIQASIKEDTLIFRDQMVKVGHARTPTTIARLIASVRHFINYAAEIGAFTKDHATRLMAEATTEIMAAGEKQVQYLTETDPTEAFCETIRSMLASHVAHLRTKDGGIPRSPETLGWTREGLQGDSLPMFKSHGKTLGWIDWNAKELMIDATAAYPDIKRHSQGSITFTKPTMLKRLKDAGLLLRTDEVRQRNTVRMTCENHTRTVLIMPLAETLQITEVPNDGFE